ncbi:MAG: hypothetical protein HY046_00700 [Acidobacteria bacterium]|nr:hypothetical protein [Acidobacteriota bacterium]
MLAILIAFGGGAFCGLLVHALLVASNVETPMPTPRHHVYPSSTPTR